MSKRIICAVILCTAFLAGGVYAQESESKTPEKGMKMPPGQMECMKDKSMRPMRGMQCPLMASPEIVATSDGGIIVLVGTKLYKYDKDLNVKKEVEIKIDKGMMEKCRAMCGLKGDNRPEKGPQPMEEDK